MALKQRTWIDFDLVTLAQLAPVLFSARLDLGFSFYFIKIGLDMFTPVGVAFGRIAFGAVTLVILSLITKTPLPPKWSWKYLFVTSLLWVSIPWMLFAFGETRVSSALAGVINGATPLMTLLAILIAFPEEKPTRQRIIGLGIGFLGVLVVVGVWHMGGNNDVVGILALIAAITCYGIAFPFVRRYLTGPSVREPVRPVSMAMGMMIWGLVITAPISAFTGVTNAPFQLGHVSRGCRSPDFRQRSGICPELQSGDRF